MQIIPSNRQLKVAELIKLALIEVLRKGKGLDVRLFDVNVTVTSVKISPDLKSANCYLLPFTSKISEAELMDAFEKSKYQLRALVTQKINLKYSPELRFYYDHGIANSNKVEEILQKLPNPSEKE